MSVPLRARRGVLLSTAMAVMALVLAGCGSSGPASPPTAAKGSASPSAPAQSPLRPYNEVLSGHISSKAAAGQFRKQEEAVAACMLKAGFPYTPKPAAWQEAEVAGVAERPDSREWVAANGYGFQQSRGDVFKKLNALDPNRSYVSGLSGAKEKEYMTALYGTQNQDGGDPKDGGCSGAGAGPPSDLKRYQPLVEALHRLYGEQVPRAEEVVTAEASWSSCMADVGLPGLDTRADAQKLAAEAGSPGDGAAAPSRLDQVDPVAREKEVKIALADFDCRAKTGYDARYQRAVNALEQDFLDDNRAQLDAVLAEAEQDGGR